MKAVYTVLLMTLVLAAAAFSQSYTWQHMGKFPPSADTLHGPGVHGIAVDPDGKVWIQHYYRLAKDSLLIPNYMSDVDTSSVDSVGARNLNVYGLHVYNKDGSEATISPIFSIPFGSTRDTISGGSITVKGKLVWSTTGNGGGGAGAGLRADPEGNIWAVYGSKVYRIDYKTGAGLAKFFDPTPARATLVAPGIDQDGNVYINRVVTDGYPLFVFDKNGAFLQNARDTLRGFSRASEVSKDGNDIYYAGFTLNAIIRYHNTAMSGVLGPWDRVDTLLKGFTCESIAWNPKTGHLWVSSGSYNNMPNAYPGVTTTWEPNVWYAYNTATDQLTGETIKWEFGVPASALERPRGIAFSPGGDTAYVIVFGGNAPPPPGVRWYKRVLTSVEPVESGIPNGYTMSQNYPNPFNPSTEIVFALPKAGFTTVKVFDMLGKEVATLVNENLGVGTFKTTLDGSRLSSGTYIYTLTSGGTRITKKMMLVK
jgi:hypothetical protein